jgi:four helix bundle protein
MNAKAIELQHRTHEFFLRVIRFCESLPRTPAATSISDQLLDAAGSTDSNYRAACRARSTREFIAKIGVAAEEADECQGWLEALRDARLGAQSEVLILIQEAHELTAIFMSSGKTAQRNQTAREQVRAGRRGRRSPMKQSRS